MCKLLTTLRSFASFPATLLFFVSFFYAGHLLAGEPPGESPAELTVRGTVSDDASAKPLVGASIAEKGTNNVVLTDNNGRFSINVRDGNAVLVVSYVGYSTLEVPVANSETVSISLKATASDLGEVVVVGYGTQNRKDVTGSVKTLKSEAFNKGIINSPQQLLQGKVAGVNVTSATGEPGGALGIT
ncbi:MAG TPA: carboxypeptidase-like regulatory domain-containing protein, partial [Chitinophagaceae bacterium]|nr:carboxypeptidase-like regulatory domain-containing protein [Chitinophagaceae bacterium]